MRDSVILTVALGVAAVILLSGCGTSKPQVLDTHSGETAQGWQCGDRPCNEDKLQHLTDSLEKLQ